MQTGTTKVVQQKSPTAPSSAGQSSMKEGLRKPNAGNTIPKRGKDEKDCVIY